MLSFLWIAAKRGFNVESYEDNAIGEMTADDKGREWISKITLDPQIAWTGEKVPTSEELAAMHHEAHDICFIANSIRSEVVIK